MSCNKRPQAKLNQGRSSYVAWNDAQIRSVSDRNLFFEKNSSKNQSSHISLRLTKTKSSNKSNLKKWNYSSIGFIDLTQSYS